MKKVEKVIVNLGIESTEKQQGWYEYVYVFDDVCTLPCKIPVFCVKELNDVRASLKYNQVDIIYKDKNKKWAIGQSCIDEVFTDMFELIKYRINIEEVYAVKGNTIVGEGKKEGNKITVILY